MSSRLLLLATMRAVFTEADAPDNLTGAGGVGSGLEDLPSPSYVPPVSESPVGQPVGELASGPGPRLAEEPQRPAGQPVGELATGPGPTQAGPSTRKMTEPENVGAQQLQLVSKNALGVVLAFQLEGRGVLLLCGVPGLGVGTHFVPGVIPRSNADGTVSI